MITKLSKIHLLCLVIHQKLKYHLTETIRQEAYIVNLLLMLSTSQLITYVWD